MNINDYGYSFVADSLITKSIPELYQRLVKRNSMFYSCDVYINHHGVRRIKARLYKASNNSCFLEFIKVKRDKKDKLYSFHGIVKSFDNLKFEYCGEVNEDMVIFRIHSGI